VLAEDEDVLASIVIVVYNLNTEAYPGIQVLDSESIAAGRLDN
jgi:hypothetical protein